MAKIQIINGSFQTPDGEPIANGTLILQLNEDAAISGIAGQVVSQVKIKVPLDSNGDVSGTVEVWPNDQLNPSNTFYIAEVYTANGQFAWGPFYGTITGSTPFDLDTWIPGVTGSGAPVGSILLQTNSVNNGNQALLNLKDGDNISITDDGAGGITLDASVPSVPNFTRRIAYQVEGLSGGSNSIVGIGAATSTSQTGSLSSSAPTATEGYSQTFSRTASASTSVACAVQYSNAGASGHFTLGILNQFSIRLQINTDVNARYWIGLFNAFASATTATDTPNTKFLGFRRSSGTDTTIKAVVGIDSTHITEVDTGVAFQSSASYLFEIGYDGSHINFYINSNLVAQIATSDTNVPTTDTLFNFGWTGDNQNTATAMSGTFQWMAVTLTK